MKEMSLGQDSWCGKAILFWLPFGIVYTDLYSLYHPFMVLGMVFRIGFTTSTKKPDDSGD